MRYSVALPRNHPAPDRTVWGFRGVVFTHDPVELELSPDQVKALRSAGLAVNPCTAPDTEAGAEAPRPRKPRRKED